MKKPVFQDETGKRWKRVKIIFFTALVIMCIGVSLYVLSLYQVVDFQIFNKIGVGLFNVLLTIFIIYIIVSIIIGISRMLFLFYFSLRQRRRHTILREYERVNRFYFKDYNPTVTVIIPVYNEEVVIKKTIESILKSKYPISEILVIDDGSIDNTSAVIRRAFGNNPVVKLTRIKNQGKATALNIGFQQAIGEVVITIDADTVLPMYTISYLVSHFKDPSVAAVSGNCKVGNNRNQLTLWQHIEYVTANNVEKRALEELNCITVVPGSNSAWRKSVVEQLGYYDLDILAEDTDLTIRIVNNGYKVVFDDRALSFEECPETVRAFLKQRFRWSYGILQSIWKNKKQIIHSNNKTLKYFAVPSILFSYLLFLTAPIIDILFIVAIFSGVKSIYLFFLLFYIADSINSIFAFKLGKENMKPLVWVFIQRLAYRYLITYVTWKTVLTALKGKQVGWQKLKRTGNNKFPI